jgi:hypothetical protein
MYPQQRRQFIPQGAIKPVGIVVVFFRFVAFMVCVFNFIVSPASKLTSLVSDLLGKFTYQMGEIKSYILRLLANRRILQISTEYNNLVQKDTSFDLSQNYKKRGFKMLTEKNGSLAERRSVTKCCDFGRG